MLLLLVVSFGPALYISYVKGMHPGWAAIGTAAVAAQSAVDAKPGSKKAEFAGVMGLFP